MNCQIKSIKIRNYRSIKNLAIDWGFNILIEEGPSSSDLSADANGTPSF